MTTTTKTCVNSVRKMAGIKAAKTRAANKLALKIKRSNAAKKAVETKLKKIALLRAGFSK